jgi:hypothetical protein
MMGLVPGMARTLPAVLEFDLSGTVADANGHSQFTNGQEGTCLPSLTYLQWHAGSDAGKLTPRLLILYPA